MSRRFQFSICTRVRATRKSLKVAGCELQFSGVAAKHTEQRSALLSRGIDTLSAACTAFAAWIANFDQVLDLHLRF